MILKWAICCCGLISHDFTNVFLEFKNEQNKVVAVAARDIERAKGFADTFKVQHYFDNYEDLALCADVDIVYIGSIHPEHCKLTKLFLNHGKHVLVEKPMAMNVKETNEMIELAREKKLFLMEGLWSRFFPIYQRIKDVTIDGTIGSIKHVNVNFQQNISVNRMWLKSLGGGALLDIGIYSIQFALWVFHGKKLLKVSKNVKKNEGGIDICANVMMEFEGNGTAFVTCHASVSGDTSAAIYGDKGSLIIPSYFWAPEILIFNGKEDQSLSTKRNNLDIVYTFAHSWGFIHEVNHVADCIDKGLLESNIHPLSETIRLAEIMEDILRE